MLGAACYAHRYHDLLERYCGGSLALGCDWEELREHYEKVGQSESRKFGCEGVTAADLNSTGAPTIASVLMAPHVVTPEQLRLLPKACQPYHHTLDTHAGSKPSEPHPFRHELHAPPPLSSRRCVAWPIELRERPPRLRRRLRQRMEGGASKKGRGGGRLGIGRSGSAGSISSTIGQNPDAEAEQIRTEMTQLAAHWLLPFSGGVGKEHIHAPSQAGEVDHGGEEWRMCSLVQIVGGKIYLQLSSRALLFPRINFANCGHTDSENGRTLTMLRLLRLALQQPGPSGGAWPDFEFRLCADDYCHGLAENADRAFFTSSVCATKRTLPGVQWNPSGGRDSDLAVWDETMARRRRLRKLHDEQWSCRLPVAVWRGDAHNHQVYNERWSEWGELSRQRFRTERWTTQGRLALVSQKCRHPTLLNVRVKLLTAGGKYVPFPRDYLVRTNGTLPAAYTACVKKCNKDKPKFIPMAEQSARFQMAVHVEGNGGWADRLRHLLLSGMVVLRQQMGVTEWWEAGLRPWVHYVPVSSTLHNLSEAVWWVRNHSAQAKEMADAAARFVERVLSTRALEAYAVALYRGYAGLYRAPPPQLASPAERLQFECKARPHTASEFGKASFTAMDCGFTAMVGASNEPIFSPSLSEIHRRRSPEPEPQPQHTEQSRPTRTQVSPAPRGKKRKSTRVA